MRASVVLGLVFSIPRQEIGLRKRLRNDLFCVEWDVKAQLSQSIRVACSVCWLAALALYKKLSYRRRTARRVVSVDILPTATQQCRNYLYNKSWINRSYEVGGLQWAMCNKHVQSTMKRSSRFHCPVGVINIPTTDEFWISPVYISISTVKRLNQLRFSLQRGRLTGDKGTMHWG